MDLTPEGPDVLALSGGDPAVHRRRHLLPIGQKVDADNRDHDKKREERDQSLPSRPKRAQDVVEPRPAHRRGDLERGFSKAEVLPHKLMQPGTARIRDERLYARGVARKLLDEEVELANDDWEHDHADPHYSDEQQKDQSQGCERAMDPNPLQPVNGRGKQ